MIKIDEIKNPIAEDTWEYKKEDGTSAFSKIIVGKPEKIIDEISDYWVCPIWIEGFTSRIVPAAGEGPVDALMNAMVLAKAFFDKIYEKEKKLYEEMPIHHLGKEKTSFRREDIYDDER